MRLLIAVDPSRMIYLEKFAFELSKFGIETKIIEVEEEIKDQNYKSNY